MPEHATARCERCNAELPIGGDRGWGCLLTEFPAHLGGCLALLSGGPGTVPCTRCNHSNDQRAPHLVRGPNACVLYLPESAAMAGAVTERSVLEAVARVRATADTTGLQITRSKPEFRRAFLRQFIEPYVSLLNSFEMADAAKLEWFEAHEAQLGPPFFAALRLAGSGALPVFTREVSGSQPQRPSFVPHESAPEAANHVVALHEAREALARNAGKILGYLCMFWTIRAFRQRSLSQVSVQGRALLSASALTESVVAAAADTVSQILEGKKPGGSGDLVLRYVLEAVFAILLHVHAVPSPRRGKWTTLQLIYDYARRRDGNDEAYLLDPELLRATIDPAQFWHDFETLGRELGMAKVSMKNKDDLVRLAAVGARVFPDEVQNHLQFSMRVDPQLTDEAALDIYRGELQRAIERLPAQHLLKALLTGVRVERRHLLVTVATELSERVVADDALSLEQKLEVLRALIENLNIAQQFAAGMQISNRVDALLAAAASDEVAADFAGRLYNEVGNSLRYGGRHREALARYDRSLDLLGRDPADANTRVALRNRAIVLRELHQYSAARAALVELKPLATDSELRGLVVSEAVCLEDLGLLEEALALLTSHRDLIAGRLASARGVLEYATLLALLHLRLGQLVEASAIATIADANTTQGYIQARVVAARVALAVAVSNAQAQPDGAAALDAAIGVLLRIHEEVMAGSILPAVLIDGTEELNRALIAVGRDDEAQSLVLRMAGRVDPVRLPKSWTLHLLAAQHALRRSNRELALSAVVNALDALSNALRDLTANDDALAILSPQAASLAELVEITLLVTQDQPQLGALCRIAGDLRSAPVLTQRLRKRISLPNAWDDPDAEDERLSRLLDRTPATVLQFVSTGSDVAVLHTKRSADGHLAIERGSLGIASPALTRISSRLDFGLRFADPHATQLPLDSVRGWRDLAARLRDWVQVGPEHPPIYVVAGPVGETALALAFCDHPICFVPSVAGLVALREQRATRFPDLRWRLASLFDFVAWFDRELEIEARALASVVSHGAELARCHGMSYDAAFGIDASGERLLQGLAGADIARIACHGRILPHAQTVDLLVAAQGHLPPADLTAINESDVHVLGWKDLAALSSAAAVVFSSACDSGRAIVNPGGERLGLERPLFAAGSLAYVAPLWPVPTAAIQNVVGQLIERWLSATDQPLATHVAWVRASAAEAGLSPLAAQALAVFGDGL